MSAFGVTFRRELALLWAGGGALAPIGYFLGATLLVPLAMGPERTLLQAAGPPLVWIAAALSVMGMLERLFQADLEDGSLDQMLLSATPLELIVFAKGAALWVAVGLPLALTGAPIAIALQAPVERVPSIVASLALGTAGFVGVGLIGAALTASVKRGGVLLALIVLPLFAPPIIFGASVASGEDVAAAFAILGGCALGGLALGPIAAAAALRLQAE
ncbi:MAG: heme exporter protein CcmB [Hyphomonadaceae bacterium]|nr:heme exporter protein CcmB [Hyphomonadaceae bacterium]